MAIYECLVYDEDKKRKSIKLEFDSQNDLNSYAIENGYKLVRVKQVKEKNKRKIKDKDLSNFCEQLGTLISSGCEITKSLNTIQFSCNPKLKYDLKKINNNLQKGNSISNSFQKTKIFSNFFINLIHVGEVTGKLDEILLNLSKYYKKEYEFKTKLKTAIIYPAMLITTLIFTIIFMLVVAVPNLKESFLGSQTDLPTSTKLLIFISDIIRYNNKILIIIFLLLILSFYQFIIKSKKMRYKLDEIIFKFKYTKEIIQAIEISKFTRCLYISSSSGIQILSALEMATNSIENKYMNEKMNISKEAIQRGYSITDSLILSNIFPDIVITMIQVGEETGKLEESLKNINSNYDSNLETLINRILKIIEPSIIIILAISVGIIAVALMNPIFDAITSFK